ncbi:MAG: hypothetical protein KDC47_10405, partial [Flavobacteriaceae bacterium]|nr:hypothetical protein [Flavobacteriaceae bacterium]
QTNCFDLKGRALEFSNFLYQYYLGMNSNSQKVDDPLSKSLYLSEQLALLPISFTMKKNLEKLITKIALKENLLEKDLCDQILRVCDSSWKKTEYKTLIQKLEIRLAPHRLLMLNALTEFQNKFENIGANILYDSSFEKEEFTLQMLVNSESNLKKLGKICHETSFEDFSKIIQGDLGV